MAALWDYCSFLQLHFTILNGGRILVEVGLYNLPSQSLKDLHSEVGDFLQSKACNTCGCGEVPWQKLHRPRQEK